MPKVRPLGVSMLRGNANNFYIRCDDDLDDQGVTENRNDEYPHIHVATDGATQWHNITYIGITFGGNGGNIDIFKNNNYQVSVDATKRLIQTHCRKISASRVHPLACYLHNIPFSVAHQ
jgi:hypothetical protein